MKVQGHININMVRLLVSALLLMCWPLTALSAAGDVRPMSPIERQAVDLAAKGELEKAMELLDKAVNGGRDDSDYVRVKGDILLAAGQIDKAEEAYKEASKLNKRNHEAEIGMGKVLIERGDFPAAEKKLKKAARLNPYPVLAYYELGLLYEKMGSLDKALEQYRKAIKKMGYLAGCSKE